MKPRLAQKYTDQVRPALMEKRNYKNLHQVPRIEKIVINMGVSASLEKAAVDDAAKDLGLITGRKAVINRSRKSIANFKLREGQAIGCHVTLRREVMYEFFDRLVAAALPRIRDFLAGLLTGGEITLWEWRTKRFSRKWIWTRSSASRGWISRL